MQNRPTVAMIIRPESARKYENCFNAMEAAGARLVGIWEDFDARAFGGLLIPGGGDVDPAVYHRPNEGSERPDRALDDHQFAAVDAFLEAGLPVMGLCRGHQVLNAYFGGTLIQDIPTRYAPPGGAPALYHSQVGGRDGAHMTHALEGSFVAELYGADFPVNTAHHQAVEALGDGLEAVQWAEDGIVEAARHRSLPVISVQWHPERMCLRHARGDAVDGLPVLRYFAEMCARGK